MENLTKIINPEGLKFFKEEQIVRPEGTQDIFLREGIEIPAGADAKFFRASSVAPPPPPPKPTLEPIKEPVKPTSITKIVETKPDEIKETQSPLERQRIVLNE